MRNCRTYSNSNGVDLKNFKTTKAAYYYPVPIIKQHSCSEVDKMYETVDEKIKANYAYEKNLSRYWGQLKANIKNAKAAGLDSLAENYQNHYNYHLAQRTAAQNCSATLKYGGKASEVTSFAFPKATKKLPIKPEPPKPEPKPILSTKPKTIPVVTDKTGGINLEPKKPISDVKTQDSGFKLSKDLILGLLGGVVLYLVVLK